MNDKGMIYINASLAPLIGTVYYLTHQNLSFGMAPFILGFLFIGIVVEVIWLLRQFEEISFTFDQIDLMIETLLKQQTLLLGRQSYPDNSVHSS